MEQRKESFDFKNKNYVSKTLEQLRILRLQITANWFDGRELVIKLNRTASRSVHIIQSKNSLTSFISGIDATFSVFYP